MKDFDFDEIDRAVNSVNTSTPVTSDGTDNSVQPPASQPTVPVEPSPALAGRRSSGQFMDVVHPSSNMRKAPLMMPERAPAQNTTPDNTPVEPTAAVTPSESTPLTPPSSSGNAWPDPIDISEKSNKDLVESNKDLNQDQNEDADIDRISDDITNELSQKSEESPDTPFISGTKVNKRPLGAFSADPTPEPTEQGDQKDSIDTNHADKDMTQTNTDTSLPDELQDNLLQIESDDSSTNLDTLEMPKEALAAVITPVVTSSVPAVEAKPVAATSIAQQYKEQPSTGDQSTGAIYDTDAYHKTLVRPAKKKSGWMWVIWILLLLVIGVGAGVAVYKFVLPLL